MQVILNQDVEKIGQRGDIVDVSRGYVRNFLVPRGLAARALDDRAKTPDGVLDLLLVELGDHYEHGFVSVDVCLLRSSVGFPGDGRRGKQELIGLPR